MNRLHWLRRCEAFTLMLAVGATSGCINSDKFTSGRLPYGGGDQLAASSPRDPFLAGGSQRPSETSVAASSPTAQPMSYGTSPNAPYYAAVQNAGLQSPQYAMEGAAPQAPQYAMHANNPQVQQYEVPPGAPQMPQYAMPAGAPPIPQYATPAGAPMTDLRQVAYTPSADNPFNTPPASQSTPSQRQSDLSASPIEQISYEMPAGMPAGSAYEMNPFAEVQGAPSQSPMPQIQPMNGASDAWQPSTGSSAVYDAGGFLPPQ